MTGRLLRGTVALGAALAVAALAGCSPGPAAGPRIAISWFGETVADPVAVAATGLQPGENVVLTATARTATGVWSARAVYAVPPTGTVRLWSDRPLVAPYPEPDPGALLWSMTGPPLSQAGLELTWAESPVDVTITADQGGRRVASATAHRSALAAGARKVPAGGGAVLLVPRRPPEQRMPAVIVIDGDEGGGSGVFAAGRLVAAGFPTLVLPAFGPEGQLPGSAALSVTEFDRALLWLALRPEVDAARIFVYGTWRAEPLALWLAAHEDGRVWGAIGASGPTALLCTSASGSPLLGGWGGVDEPVPCQDPEAPATASALPPIAQIPGPVLLACGTADVVLPSACDWLRAADVARSHALFARDDQLFVARDAGHDLSTPPLLPIGLSGQPPSTAQATEDARGTFWTLVSSMLQQAIRP